MLPTTEITVPAPPARRPTVTAWVLRVVLTLTAASAVAQPVLIGGYLDGRFELVAWHGGNGGVLVLLVMLSGAAALAYVWPGGGRPWPLLALVGLWVGVTVQVVAGYTRTLGLHVPLGVLLVTAALALAVWSWTPSARQPRRGWW